MPMEFLRYNCSMFPHAAEMIKFSCGDKDLDDFFYHDAEKYERQLLGRTYCFRLKNDNSIIVCAFTLSNSSIDARNLPNNRRKKLTIFSSETQEKEYVGLPLDKELKTRLMYFDLILLK